MLLSISQELANLRKNTRWYHKSFSGYFFGIHQQGLAVMHCAVNDKYKRFALKFGICFVNYQHKDHFDWFWNINEQEKYRALILGEIKKDGSFLDKFVAHWERKRAKFVNYYDSLTLDRLLELKEKQLAPVVKKLNQLCIEQAGLGYIIDSFLTDEGDWLVEAIKAELGDKLDHNLLEVLTSPSVASFVNESEVSLLEVAQKIREHKNPKKIRKSAESHVKRYFWTKTNYFEYLPLTVEQTLHEAAELERKTPDILARINEEKHRIQNNKKAKAAALKKHNVSKNLRKIIHAAEMFTYIQDRRKEGVLRTNTVLLGLLFHEAEKNHIDKRTMGALTVLEFIDYLSKKKVDWNDVQKRASEGAAGVFFNGVNEIMFARDYSAHIEVKNFFKDHAQVTEIKGSVAYKGLVRGVVRVLRNSRHIGLFETGGILVANQTTPEFVPAMKKAAAIVTDQGGITCHAAIVARELKKPCVIGTKNATKVLKDGDFVEVDAQNGIVRLVKA